MDMNLSKLHETVKNKGAWQPAVHGGAKSWTQLSDWRAKTTLTESRSVVARGWGRGERRMTASGYRTSFWNDEKGLKSDSGDGGCEHTKTHWIVHSNRMIISVMQCELYLNLKIYVCVYIYIYTHCIHILNEMTFGFVCMFWEWCLNL